MAVFTKEFLSGSTNGKAILISATSSAGTTLHTVGVSAIDELWIYAYNNDVSAINLTIEWGGTTTTDQITQSIPSKQGLVLIIPGLVLSNSLVIRGFASTGNQITITGFVNRIT